MAAPGFTDGACLVELAAVDEPRLLVAAVASALGLPAHPPGSRLDAVLAHLRDRRLLLILDTCEHLIDACAMLAEAIIAQAPRLTLLETSREPLDVSGENACPVAPLPVPSQREARTIAADVSAGAVTTGDVIAGTAVDLFLQRAAAAVPGFTVTPGDLPDVIRLCQRLDGIPLAVELAAVRLRALPLAELASRLDQDLALLTNGQRGGRHKTLRDAIGWSHSLCTPAERTMWARLSVFAGPFTMSAAEEVCADGPDTAQVMPTVIRLVDKSVLVRIDPALDAVGQPAQYLMLDTIREFGAEQLDRSGAAAATRNRFVARYLAMARHLRDHFLDDDQLARLRALGREHGNVTAAVACALGDHDAPGSPDGTELASALSTYWRARGLAREGGYWLGRAARRAPPDSAARGLAELERGHFLTMQGDAAGAIGAATAALAVAAALGDERLTARAHLMRTGALGADGRLAAAAAAGAEAKRRLTALGDQLGLINLEIQLAYLALRNDDIEAALGHVERGLRQLGDSRERSLHADLYLLAALALYLAGRDIESTWAVTRALQVKQETGDALGIAFALELLGWLAARSGSHQRAAWLLGGADPLWEQAGGRLAAMPVLERQHAEALAGCDGALGGGRRADLFARGARHPLAAMADFARSEVADPAEAAAPKIHRPGQLTAREREIASLVAAGLSNRQIATRLVISRRTVDAHLEHIFGKLGITSRVMLTIQLREHSTRTDTSPNA